MNYELTFETAAEAANYFFVLSFHRLPIARETLSAQGYSDAGQKIVTFARRLYRPSTISYSFTEQLCRA
jgi:hypothetical protein